MLQFSFRRAPPVILQTEAAECGLACLAMVASYHGFQIDLASLRARHSMSLKGATLADLMQLAGNLALNGRALRAELHQLTGVRLPCVLHWDFNHFVVLVAICGERVVVHDPALGRRELTFSEMSPHFTGVVLELLPTPDFITGSEVRRVRMRTLIGSMQGWQGTVAQVLLLALVLQVFAIAGPFYIQWVVDHAVVAQDRDLIVVLAMGFLLLALVQTAVTALRGWVLMVLGTTLNLQLVSNLFRHLIRLPMEWFDKRHMGDVVSRFESLNTIQRTLTGGFVEALIDGVMVITTLALMLFYSVGLAMVAIVAAALYAVLRFALYPPLRLATEEQIVCAAKRESHFLETLRGMQSIKIFAREPQRTAVWQNLTVDQFNASIRTQRLNVLYQAGNGLLFGAENVITIWLGALLVLDAGGGKGFSVGMLFAFIAYKAQFVQRIAALIEKGLELRMLGLHVQRVGDVALAEAECQGDSVVLGPAKIGGAIEFKGVSFRYSDTDPLVIDNLSFRIEEGEAVAIVGPSGCGKTTVIKLALGLLAPTSGTIEIGGVPISRLGLGRYRSAVASVMQDDQLFAGSILENICFFDPQPDMVRIEACARLAAVFDEIAVMPMQFNTLVGDMGTVLSGGQKQRILLARALYRRPSILFLDEATSHLDVARERSVNDAVRALKLTRLIVAHRPETIASADRVIVLGNGRLVSAMGVLEGGTQAARSRPAVTAEASAGDPSRINEAA